MQYPATVTIEYAKDNISDLKDKILAIANNEVEKINKW